MLTVNRLTVQYECADKWLRNLLQQHYEINLEYIVARNRNHAAMNIMLKNMFWRSQ